MSHIWETSLIGLYNSHKSNENDWGDWAVRKLNKINDSEVSQFSTYNEVFWPRAQIYLHIQICEDQNLMLSVSI